MRIAIVYGIWKPRDLAPILSSTIKESSMLLLIIGMSLLYSYVMSYLHISQSAAQAVVAMALSKWVLLAVILLMVVVFGFFLPREGLKVYCCWLKQTHDSRTLGSINP